jgi:hypothetical protein
MVIGPTIIALVLSWLYHPVLWYPRFCTLILPPAVVVAAIAAASRRWVGIHRILALALVATACVGLVRQHQALTKGGMRAFARFWWSEGPPDAVRFYPTWKRKVARYELGPALHRRERPGLERRLGNDDSFVLWVCTAGRYDPSQRPRWERRERERLLALGRSRLLGVVDRLEIVEISSPIEPGSRGFADDFESSDLSKWSTNGP